MATHDPRGHHDPVNIHADASLYAIDALDADEARAFEAHLSACPECRAAVEAYRETAGRLGESAALDPPPELRATVLASVREQAGATASAETTAPTQTTAPGEAPTGEPAPASAPSPTPATGATVTPIGRHRGSSARTSRRRWLLVAAAAILVPGVALGGWAVGHETGRQNMQASLQRDHDEQQQRQEELLMAPDMTMSHMPPHDGVSGMVISSKSRSSAMFIGSDFTDPGPGKQYQLWLMMDDGTPAPEGTFDAGNPNVWLTGDVGDARSVAITVEPAGGSAKPTSDVMMTAAIEDPSKRA